MASKILATIAIAISGLLGLPAILYVFGSASVTTGSTIGNEALTGVGWQLLGFGTLLLVPILLFMFLLKGKR